MPAIKTLVLDGCHPWPGHGICCLLERRVMCSCLSAGMPCAACRRSPTPPEVRLQRERERELAELERATRTVFAFNINIKADERHIFEFFAKAGQVRHQGPWQQGVRKAGSTRRRPLLVCLTFHPGPRTPLGIATANHPATVLTSGTGSWGNRLPASLCATRF